MWSPKKICKSKRCEVVLFSHPFVHLGEINSKDIYASGKKNHIIQLKKYLLAAIILSEDNILPSFQKLDVATLNICHSDYYSYYYLKYLIAFCTQSVRELAAWRPWLQVKILMFLHKYFHPICVSVAMTPLIRLSTILHFKNWMLPLEIFVIPKKAPSKNICRLAAKIASEDINVPS